MRGRFLNIHANREIVRAFRAIMDQLALESTSRMFGAAFAKCRYVIPASGS